MSSTLDKQRHRTVSDRSPAERVETALADWIDERPMPENLREALRYVLLAGGKRVRPTVLIQACEACGGRAEDAMPAAVAIELIHNFSLVHDDLPAMDDDDLRRGRPTLHRQAGEAMAILAGDMMLGMAFEAIARKVESRPLAGDLCRELAEGTDGMIAGQVYDTLPDFDESTEPLERLRTVHRNKTAALIRAAGRMGALCGGADDSRLDALTRYGEAIGLMFQVVDDILDVTQTTEHLGKTAHKDEQQGKLTYPALLGLDGSREEVERLRREALGALEPFGPEASPLRELCERLATRTR